MRWINGRIYLGDNASTIVSALAVADGRVRAVGERNDLVAGGETFDLRGRFVLPGLIDAHGHLRGLAEARLNVDLSDAHSSAEAAARVAARVATAPPERWIVGRGWDQTRWPEARFPDRTVLDAVAPAHPVALTRIDGHALWVNSAALAAADIDDATADPPGGRILRDAAGHATGILLDAAADRVRRLIPPLDDETLREALSDTARACAAVGLTGVHEMGVDHRQIAAYHALIAEGDPRRFPLRLLAAINGPGETWREWRGRGPERRYGDRLTVGAIKLYADGALGSRGAALLEPYTDDPGNTGIELAPAADLERWTRDAVAAGFQVCIHAIGDRANHTVLDIYERVLADHPGYDLRLRVEHAQVLAAEDIPRFARLGVIASMQPRHCTSDAPWAEARLGPARARRAYAWRLLLESGAIIAGGSDFPVEPPDPLLGIAAAVTRTPVGGAPFYPAQRMTRREAVRAFTRDAAYAGFDEDRLGTLEPGKCADFVVLDRDIFTCPAEEIAATRVLMTVLGGEVVYHDPEAW
jgi:predicted amidohydrolase YtcJ